MISLLWKDCSDGCSETNCDSMQNGGITFIFINKESFSFSAVLKKMRLLLQPLIKTKNVFGAEKHVVTSVNSLLWLIHESLCCT